jgi:putative flavoprotein involved in K+ transport
MFDPGPERHTDVLIVGAGPAGLALGFELKQRGVACLILERGAAAGESWRRMPMRLKLVSPWKANRLPGTPSGLFPRHHETTREEFLRYLKAYARDNQLPVHTGVEVRAVERDRESSFRVPSSGGEFTSRMVVNATGYFSHPFVPSIAGADSTHVPQVHVADFRDAECVRQRLGRPSGQVLVVGQRLSAGQTMVELVNAGFDVALSHRSPLAFGSGPLSWWFLFRIFPWLEAVKLKRQGERAPANDVKMQGGRARELIESGAVMTFPAISRFEHDAVHFANGATLTPDLVIYATGFRPALAHLSSLGLEWDTASGSPRLHDLESVSVPGLFFLGLDGARNFQSRFIRGIRNDARFLAERIEQRLDAGANSVPGSLVAPTVQQSRIETMTRRASVAQTVLSAGSRDIPVPSFRHDRKERRLESRLHPQTGMSALRDGSRRTA